MKISYVHRTPRFDSALRDLRSQGGRALLIAENIEQMVSGLLQGKGISEIGRQTRNGECRIDQCFKFYLGSGYRVVCLTRGKCFVFLYAGTHDDCCRWIERNRGMKYDSIDISSALPIINESTAVSGLPTEAEEERRFSEEYEKSIMKRLDDGILRRILCGRAQSDCS